MGGELIALTTLYADFYHSNGDIERIAEQSGLDATKLPIGYTSPATAWHMVTAVAIQENRMADMYAIIKKEHPRNEKLPVAWEAYLKTQDENETPPPSTTKVSPPPMSDNWRYDVRIDALQKEVADLRTLVAELRTNLNYLVTQSANMEKQNQDILAQLKKRDQKEDELPHNAAFYLSVAAAITVIVIAIIYLGGYAT